MSCADRASTAGRHVPRRRVHEVSGPHDRLADDLRARRGASLTALGSPSGGGRPRRRLEARGVVPCRRTCSGRSGTRRGAAPSTTAWTASAGLRPPAWATVVAIDTRLESCWRPCRSRAAPRPDRLRLLPEPHQHHGTRGEPIDAGVREPSRVSPRLRPSGGISVRGRAQVDALHILDAGTRLGALEHGEDEHVGANGRRRLGGGGERRSRRDSVRSKLGPAAGPSRAPAPPVDRGPRPVPWGMTRDEGPDATSSASTRRARTTARSTSPTHLWSEVVCLERAQELGPIADPDSDALCIARSRARSRSRSAEGASASAMGHGARAGGLRAHDPQRVDRAGRGPAGYCASADAAAVNE